MIHITKKENHIEKFWSSKLIRSSGRNFSLFYFSDLASDSGDGRVQGGDIQNKE